MVSNTLLSLLATAWEPRAPRSLNLEQKRYTKAAAESTEQQTAEAKQTQGARVGEINDKAQKEKDLSDKRKLASMLQGVTDYKGYNDATGAFFDNTYPDLDPKQRESKLLSWGLDPVYSDRTKQNIGAIENEVVNDVDQRKTKDLLSYEYGLKAMIEEIKNETDPIKYQSARAKLAADYQLALSRGDHATAAVVQKYMQSLGQQEQANARKAEQDELASSMKTVFPELGATDSKGNLTYDIDQSTYLVVQGDLKKSIDRYNNFDKAVQYTQRKWILEPSGVPGFKTHIFRPRTEEELNDYDIDEVLAAPDDINEVSELYQHLNNIKFR